MGDDDTVGSEEDGVAENLLVVYDGLGRSAGGEAHALDDGVATGEEKDPAFFVVEVFHYRVEIEGGEVCVSYLDLVVNGHVDEILCDSFLEYIQFFKLVFGESLEITSAACVDEVGDVPVLGEV